MNAPVARSLRSRPWFWLSISAALVSAVVCCVGLLDPARVFDMETATLFEASIAQDLVNLFLVAPLTVILAFLSVRGSLRSWFASWASSVSPHTTRRSTLSPSTSGCCSWCGSLCSGCPHTPPQAAWRGCAQSPSQFGRVSMRLPGWFLMATAALFALFWLREIVSDLLVSRPSTSAITWNVPTNPVHVLNLAIFLPGVFVAGLLLLRRDPLGHATAPGALIFLGLTTLPIMVSLFVAQANGHAPSWPLAIPMGIMALATLALLWRMLRQIGKPPDVLPGEAS